VPLTNAVPGWTLVMPAGTAQLWNFIFTTVATGNPYPISGATWEYVVRTSPGSGGSPLIEVTTTVGPDGLLTVTSTAALSQVAMDLYPAATMSLSPGSYFHALWMNPGTNAAYSWFTGLLQIESASQP
jgi:hypothetical protein